MYSFLSVLWNDSAYPFCSGVFFQMNLCLRMPRTCTAFLKSWLAYWLPLSVRTLSREQSGFSAATAFVIESYGPVSGGVSVKRV